MVADSDTDVPAVCVLGAVRINGPLGRAPLGGALPKGLLAVLASESGRPVSIDRMADLLWGAEVPSGVKAALQQLATRVRRALASAGLGTPLRAEPPGYVLDLDPAQVDLLRFRGLMRQAVEADRAGDAVRAARLAGDALPLWEGRAFADLVELPVGAYLGPLIDDERWRAEELRAQALMAIDRPDEAASLLARAVADEPLRERLWVLNANALAAAGRHNEAVRCARTGIAVIVAELGIPPGPELTDLVDRYQGEVARRPTARQPDVSGAPAQRGLLDDAILRALTNAERAALSAMSRRSFGEAAHQWQRALELLAGSDDANEHRQRILLGLADAYNEGGQAAAAQAACLEAAALARERRDPTGLALAALGYCADHIAFDPPPQQAAMLHEALDALGPDEHMLRGRLYARLATEIYWSESAERTRQYAEQALVEAELAGDTEGRLRAMYAMLFGWWTPDHPYELVASAEHYLDSARAVGDRFHELLARRWLVTAVSALGDVARGDREARAAMDLADDLGTSVQQWVTRVVAAGHALLAGDLTRAEQLANEGLALGAVAEPETALDYVSLLLWSLRWMQGRLDEIASLVEEVAAGPGVDLPRRLGLAVTHAEMGRLDEARAILAGVSADDLDELHRDAAWLIAMAAAAEAAAATDDVRLAAMVRTRLSPYRQRISITTTTATGPVAHHIGLCSWTLGDHEEGERALREAISIADRCGVAAFGALSRIALAERLASVGRNREAIGLAEAADPVADAIGLPGVSRRVARVVEGCTT